MENFEFVLTSDFEKDGISPLISTSGFSIVRFILRSPENREDKGISTLTFLKETKFSLLIDRPFISLIPIDGGKRDRVTLSNPTLSGN